MNKLLIAPTTLKVEIPVVLDLQESQGVTVKANVIQEESVHVDILIGGSLRAYTTITADKPLATLPGGEIYALTKTVTVFPVGVFVSAASHTQSGSGNAVLWGDGL